MANTLTSSVSFITFRFTKRKREQSRSFVFSFVYEKSLKLIAKLNNYLVRTPNAVTFGFTTLATFFR
jgi:hypothetical protein